MANETFADEQPSADPPGRRLVIILPVVVISTVGVGVILFCIWVRSRRHSSHFRLDDEQNSNEEPIPLQNLATPENGETAVHETGDPSVSTSNIRRPRTLNEYTKALSSHPPSQTDLATAEQALNPKTRIKKQDMGIPAVVLSPPSPVLILPISLQPGPSQEQSYLHPTRRSNSRPDDPRRHGKVFEFGDNHGDFTGDETLRAYSNLPPLPPAGPGIETMPNVLDEYHQQQELPLASTITEEGTPDITDTPDTKSAAEFAENVPESYFTTLASQSPEADKDKASIFTKRDDEPLSPPHEGFVQDDKANDADDESETISQAPDSGTSLQDRVRDFHGDSHDSYIDEVYNPKDPLYDVHGVVKFGKNNGPESNTSKAEQTAQTLGGDDNDSSEDYARFQRDYTNASLVPAPLVRRNNTVHETPSPAVTSSTATQPVARPASAADVDISLLEPEIETQRPRSFVIREWPPQNNPDATFENAPRRQALWYTPPSQEIIERSRSIREQMEWEEEAKKVVLQKARDKGETLSEEEIDKRVRRMYERSSRFMLEAATYKPATSPAQPHDTVSADSARNSRVRAQRASLVQPSGNVNPYTSQKKRPVSSEPAFASSQALPFAASTTSVVAQDGSRSGSPPAPRRRLRRSNPEHDLSRPR
ncbi:hypothetical protein F4679DRAFT_581114 [Xylaria curta]|nr:hypothetical protein F4679DRAFT_581114 [Xylaria curta]